MELLTTAGSVAAAIFAGATLFLMWRWRVADRPNVQVVSIVNDVDSATVAVRNIGGGDATITGLRLWEIGTQMPPSGHAEPVKGAYSVPGKDRGEMVYTRAELAKYVPPTGRVFAAATQTNGRVSKPIAMPSPIVEWLRAR